MLVSFFESSQDYIMASSEPVKKKYVEYKKHTRMVEVLKKFVRATMIIKHILDLRVNLIVNNLLALAFVVKK